MEIKEFLVIFLSSTVVSAVVTALVNYLNSKKTAYIDDITKERKAWREQLRSIAEKISKCVDREQLKEAICELKVRINAYGIARDSLFADTFLWEMFQNIEQQKELSPKELERIKITLINQISCVLKYDWERSKAEIKGNTQNKIVILGLVLCFALSILKGHYYYLSVPDGGGRVSYVGDLNGLVNFCVWYALLVVYSVLVIQFADKWRTRIDLFFYVFLGLVGGSATVYFLYKNTTVLNSPEVNAMIIVAPIATLIYSTYFKASTYAKNAREYVLSSVISSGETVIDKKYSVYFVGYKKRLKNKCTGKSLIIGTRPSQICVDYCEPVPLEPGKEK